MLTTSNLNLNKPELTDIPDITAINPNWDKLDAVIQSLTDGKVNIVVGKGLSTNDFTTEEQTKLKNIEVGANKYIHPATHSASMITGLHTIATSGSYNDLLNKPSTFQPSVHTHDDRYYTETEIDNKLGVLSGLETTAKTNLVSAINENKTDISTNTQQINDLYSKCATSTIDLLNGWTLEFGNNKIAKNNTVITFNLNIKGGTTTVGTNICRLPEGFRPSDGLLIDYLCYDSNWTASVGTVWISPDGYMTIAEGNTVYNNRLVINADFVQ